MTQEDADHNQRSITGEQKEAEGSLGIHPPLEETTGKQIYTNQQTGVWSLAQINNGCIREPGEVTDSASQLQNGDM